jgi:hypothetical protein
MVLHMMPIQSDARFSLHTLFPILLSSISSCQSLNTTKPFRHAVLPHSKKETKMHSEYSGTDLALHNNTPFYCATLVSPKTARHF